MIGSRIFAATVFAASFSPALADIDVPVPAFSGIEAHGGASVVLRHGPVQKVTIVKGDLKVSKITVNGTSLDIEACPHSWTGCPFGYKLQVEITSPHIEAMDAHGGGAIRVEGDFPQQKQLHLEAHGGGAIDSRAIPAEEVYADAHGGGAIHTRALASLHAEAHGGGAIDYAGNPPQVFASAHGGGAISRK